jgi:hypothetical protein
VQLIGIDQGAVDVEDESKHDDKQESGRLIKKKFPRSHEREDP